MTTEVIETTTSAAGVPETIYAPVVPGGTAEITLTPGPDGWEFDVRAHLGDGSLELDGPQDQHPTREAAIGAAAERLIAWCAEQKQRGGKRHQESAEKLQAWALTLAAAPEAPAPLTVSQARDLENSNEVQSSAQAAPDVSNLAVKWIPIENVIESPWNPRKIFGEKELRELSSSMAVAGFHPWHAIIARPAPDDLWLLPALDRSECVEIGAGHRRRRAASIAGLTHVTVIVREMGDEEFLKLLNFENGGHEDIHPLHQAAGWRFLMERTGVKADEIAAQAGVSKRSVYVDLQIERSLIPAGKKAYLEGKIQKGHAALIAPLEAADQANALRSCEPPASDLDRGPVGVRPLANWIRRNLHIDLEEAPFEPQDADLVAATGSCVPCEFRSENTSGFDPAQDLPNICTRRECYDQKLDAHVNREMKRTDLVFVSEVRGAKPVGILPVQDWTETPPFGSGQAQGQRALIVEGPRKGHEISVRVRERSDASGTSAPKPGPSAPPVAKRSAPKEEGADIESQREADEARDRARADRDKQFAAERAVRTAILRAVLGKTQWPPQREEVAELLSPDVLAELPDDLTVLLPDLGLEPGVAFQEFSELSDVQFARLIRLVAVSGDFSPFAYGHGADTLHAVARRAGVDVGAIREQAKEGEGGTRKEVVGKLGTLASAKAKAKRAPAKKAPSAKKVAPAKKAAAKKPAAKKSAKPAPKKKRGK